MVAHTQHNVPTLTAAPPATTASLCSSAPGSRSKLQDKVRDWALVTPKLLIDEVGTGSLIFDFLRDETHLSVAEVSALWDNDADDDADVLVDWWDKMDDTQRLSEKDIVSEPWMNIEREVRAVDGHATIHRRLQLLVH